MIPVRYRSAQIVLPIFLYLLVFCILPAGAGPIKPPEFDDIKPPPNQFPVWSWLPQSGFYPDSELVIDIRVYSNFRLTGVWFEDERIFSGSRISGEFQKTISLPGHGEYAVRVTGIGSYYSWYTGEFTSPIDQTRIINYRPGLNLEILNIDFPDSVDVGETTTATVTYKNTGNLNWTEADQAVLRLTGHAQDLGLSDIPLKPGQTVPPGSTHTFEIPITGSEFPGHYHLDWQLNQQGIAWHEKRTEIIRVGEPKHDAQLVDYFIPDSIALDDDPATLTFTLRNTGETAWSERDFRIIYRDSPQYFIQANTWNPLLLSYDEMIYPGEELTMKLALGPAEYAAILNMKFGVQGSWNGSSPVILPDIAQTITVGEPEPICILEPSENLNADLVPGGNRKYYFSLSNTGNTVLYEDQIAIEPDELNDMSYIQLPELILYYTGNYPDPDGAMGSFRVTINAPFEDLYLINIWHLSYLGQQIPDPLIHVVKVGSPVQEAELVSADFPDTMYSGESSTVTIQLKNNGNTIWRNNQLHSLGNPDGHGQPFAWPRQTLPAGVEVAPGETYTFAFEITAPAQPGTYTQRWQMVQDAVQWFGELMTHTITVNGRTAIPADHWHQLD